MRSGIHRLLSSLPGKLAGALGTLATLWSAGDPDGFKQAWSWAMSQMSPETIRLFGFMGLGVCCLYWLALWWLEPPPPEAPKTQEPGPSSAIYNQTHSGSGDNTINLR